MFYSVCAHFLCSLLCHGNSLHTHSHTSRHSATYLNVHWQWLIELIVSSMEIPGTGETPQKTATHNICAHVWLIYFPRSSPAVHRCVVKFASLSTRVFESVVNFPPASAKSIILCWVAAGLWLLDGEFISHTQTDVVAAHALPIFHWIMLNYAPHDVDLRCDPNLGQCLCEQKTTFAAWSHTGSF